MHTSQTGSVFSEQSWRLIWNIDLNMRKIAYQTPLSAFFVLVSAVYALMIMHKNDNAMVNTVTQKQRCTEEVCDWWGAPCVNALRTTRRVDQLPAAAGLCFAYAHSNMHRQKCQLTILLFNTSSKQTNKTFPDWLWRVPSKRTTKRKKNAQPEHPWKTKSDIISWEVVPLFVSSWTNS